MDFRTCVKIVRDIVYRHRFYEQICSGEDFDKLLYIFKLHPRFAEKTKGLKVKCFVIEPNMLGKGFTLYAILSDGSKVDWSFIKACSAINGNDVIKRMDALQAFRLAVEEQIGELIRSRTFGGKILADNGRLYDRSEVEVHHKGKPFIDLVNEFLKLKGLRLEDIKTIDIGIGRDFADPELKKEWIEFHKKHAKLVIIPKKLHRKLHGYRH